MVMFLFFSLTLSFYLAYQVNNLLIFVCFFLKLITVLFCLIFFALIFFVLTSQNNFLQGQSHQAISRFQHMWWRLHSWTPLLCLESLLLGPRHSSYPGISSVLVLGIPFAFL